jgi:hypothetical protein
MQTMLILASMTVTQLYFEAHLIILPIYYPFNQFAGWPKSNRGSRKKDESRPRIHRLILVTGFPSAHHDPVGAHHHHLRAAVEV